MSVDVERLVAEALREGADEAVAVYTELRSMKVEAENGRPKSAESGVRSGVTLTVIVGKRVASASATAVAVEPGRLAASAVSAARAAGENPHWSGLPDPSPVPQVQVYDPEAAAVGPEELSQLLREMLGEALEAQVRVPMALVEAAETRVSLASSRGHSLEYRATSLSSFMAANAVEGGVVGSIAEDFYSTRRLKGFEEASMGLAARVSRWARESLNPEKVEPFEGWLILDWGALSYFLSAVADAYNGENVWMGSSRFAGKLGEEVAAQSLTMIDDGTLPWAPGTSPFDGEGTGRRRTAAVERGVLKNYIANTYYARLLGVEATGNSYGLLSVSPTNIVVEPGRGSPLEEAERAVYARYLTGDIRHEDGVVSVVVKQGVYLCCGDSRPVAEVSVSDDLYSMLGRIVSVGGERGFRSGVYAPPIAISGVSFSPT